MALFFPGNFNTHSDPQVMFDQLSQRFFISTWTRSTVNAALVVNAPNPDAGTFSATAASFGQHAPFSVSGNIVATIPLNASTGLTNPGAIAGNIALCQRGSVTFVTKVKNCQNAGATGVIVFDNLSEPLITMGGADPTITIPAIFISLSDGNNLLANLPATGTIASISPPEYSNIYHIGVSKTASPQSAADWFTYQFTIPGWENYVTDFPKLTVDQTSLYFSIQDFNSFSALASFQAEIVTLDKASLLDGTGAIVTAQHTFPFQEFLWPARLQPPIADTLMPTFFIGTNADITPPAVGSNSTALRVYNSGDFTFVDIPYPTPMSFGIPSTISIGPSTPQSAGVAPLETLTEYPVNALLINDSLWCVQNWMPAPNKFIARWYQLDVSNFVASGQITLVQWGDVDPGSNVSIVMPSIMANSEGSMMIQFTIVGPTQPPSIAYTGRLKNDPFGTVRMPLQVPVPSQYFYDGGNETATLPGGGTTVLNRWGDYSSLVIDPVDHETFWLSNEYPSQRSIDVAGNVSYAWTTAIATVMIGEDSENNGEEISFVVPKPINGNVTKEEIEKKRQSCCKYVGILA